MHRDGIEVIVVIGGGGIGAGGIEKLAEIGGIVPVGQPAEVNRWRGIEFMRDQISYLDME